MKSNKKTVSLVLGSGGARGLAHIGVIRWLEENEYEIKSIAGCSIGSVIGGVYAAGKLGELEAWMRALTKLDVISLLDVAWIGAGIFKGDKVINTMVELLGDTQIEDLPIPFTAVAADLETEQEVWINSGSLFGAIRASVSLPLFFTPYEYNGAKLIDGGVLNPVPIAPVFNDKTDLTIAVNLGGPLEFNQAPKNNPIPFIQPNSKILKEIKKLIVQVQSYDQSHDQKKWGMYDVANKAFDAMQSTIARQKISAYPPDIEIIIARDACGTLDFDMSSEMIELGYKKAEKFSDYMN